MSTEHWIIYDVATGTELMRGYGPKGSAVQQVPGEGRALMQVSQAAALSIPLDLDLVRADLRAKVDADAENVRALFITTGSGQALSYQRKEAEARGWTDGDDPATAPFLAAEAAALGIGITALAATVIAQADAWVAVGSVIEGARIGAKAAIGAADNLTTLAAAATVDWEGILQ